MNSQPKYRFFVLFAVACFLLTPHHLPAQTNCESGNGVLSSDSPNELSPEEIIHKFTAKETVFKLARRDYIFTQDLKIETLRDITPRGTPIVDGEFRQVMDVSYDASGNRMEHVTFAPESTLRRISFGPHDLDDVRDIMPFMLTVAELPHYSVKYVGKQHVDELDTYVFDVTPKNPDKNKRYFSGRLWVENRDFAVVKTCGKSVPETASTKKNGKGTQDVAPKFVTYREQIDGNWLPTYTRSDDFLWFNTGFVRIREIVKYKNYRKPGSHDVPSQAVSPNK